jgi:UDP-2,4-diacetamido-2,4,6-trideoxy-beta-L-altropyranose hydrolase
LGLSELKNQEIILYLNFMKFVILTEGGHDIGLGHIARCTSFYDELEHIGHDVEFIIQGDDTIKNVLVNRVYSLMDWHGRMNEFLGVYKDFTAVILDSLTISQNDVSILCESNLKLLAIDDYLRNSYQNSIVLDWTVNVENTNKHAHNSSNNLLLLGAEYAVVRKAFLNHRIPRCTGFKSILITMGGSDIHNLSVPLLKSIFQSYSDIFLHVISGPFALNKDELLHLQSHKIAVHSSLNAQQMCSLMSQSDLAISAGGQTLYELAAMGIPTITIQVIDNQNEDTEGWFNKGLIYKSYQWNERNLYEKILRNIEDLRPRAVRQNIRNKVKGSISSGSCSKIIKILIASL